MSKHEQELHAKNSDKFIDIEGLIKEKNPKLIKLLPRFVLKYIKTVLHEDELNAALIANKDKYEYDFAIAAFEEFGPKVKIIGLENVPKTGGCIIAANHPLGGLDGISLMYVIGAFRKDMRFLVNDLLLKLKNYGSIFVPVNKLGRNPQEYLTKIEDTYASDACVLVFPAGLCSRKQDNGEIMDLIWRKSFINKSVQYKKDIIPCYVEARNSNRFYNLAYWRKKIGIKANIEMFYLVDEMYKQRGKDITFTFGKPIPYNTFSNLHSDVYWAEKIKHHVYALRKDATLTFKH